MRIYECQKCGGEPGYNWRIDHGGQHQIECKTCGQKGRWSSRETDAIGSWNKTQIDLEFEKQNDEVPE